MSRRTSPDTSEARKRMIFSGNPQGVLPEESEKVTLAYESDVTDLKVYDYSDVALSTRRSGHYTFFFEESDHAINVGKESLAKFDEAVQILEEEGSRDLVGRFENAGPLARLGKNITGFEHEYNSYVSDFNQILDESLVD